MGKRSEPISWRPPASLRARIESLADEQGVALTKVIEDLCVRGLSITNGSSIRVKAVRGSKVKTKTPRTDLCEHRRPPGQYCSRCDD